MNSLGACCACEAINESVRNIMCLDKKAPVLPGGWGCVVCHLPNEGAVAVVCDKCLEANKEIKFACLGYPGECKRIPIGDLTGEHKHDMSFHKNAITTDVDFTFCQNCNQITAITDDLECADCGKTICVICGANESNPAWARPGVCVNCA